MYSINDLSSILERLLQLPSETEVVEFKKAQNSFSENELGQYFSALSNEANLKGIKNAWLIFGVDNQSHIVLGTNYKNFRPSLDALKKLIGDQTTNRITFEEVYDFKYNDKRVVMFQIPATPNGIPMAYKGHYYGRDGESLVALNLQEIESIRSQSRNDDWSAMIVKDASIDDLDDSAIMQARSLYATTHPSLKSDMEKWDDITFLNKAKITIKGKITNTAIILLGKEESAALLSPSVSQIKWILKSTNGIERDYEIFTSPLLLAVDKVYSKIRNLKYRYINPEFQTLFPQEMDTYEPYVIREALNNAIAHQDYLLCGQINVVEYDDKLIFTNRGSFIPGIIENVLLSDAPEDRYRNRFLVNAMVGLKMVDTIGSGIRKMYNFQKDRLFPTPDYHLSSDKVEVVINGKVIDNNYASILIKDKSLSLVEIELLNRVQLGRKLSSDELKLMRSKGLVEGRNPNLYIAKSVAQKVGKKAEYSKHKGLDSRACENMLLEAIGEHGVLSKSDIVELLWNVMPDVLDDVKKRNKINNILTKLRIKNLIYCEVRGNVSIWKKKI